ncbi:MAG TPA: glycogen debranching enzyme, partial [Nitrospirae bacterium]|nr:glycogen debranching enzyme [Nitrospirota bacterium]
KIYEPDWSYYSHSIAVTIVSLTGRLIFHMIANAYWEDLIFEIPNASDFNGKQWLLWIDTSLNPPHDISSWHDAKPFNGKKYKVKARSIVILLSFKKEGEDKKLFNK